MYLFRQLKRRYRYKSPGTRSRNYIPAPAKYFGSLRLRLRNTDSQS